MSTKPVLYLYIKQDAKTTKILLNFIGKHIDAINKKFVIKSTMVTSKNAAEVKSKGVSRTPTLIVGKQKYETLEKIVKVITPATERKEGFGFSTRSPEELTQSYLDGVLNSKDDDDDPVSGFDEDFRRKMANFQKRRPAMEGVEKSSMLKGGRKITAKKKVPQSFSDDSEFQEFAGVNNLENTPSDKYFSETDGDALLEEYYNKLADEGGRKPNNKRIRWSS
jgi:hypothetical protein